MICPMKQIINLDSKYIDSYSQKKKKKKYIDSYNTKLKKKMIDVHTVNKKKKQRNWDFCRDSLHKFFAVNMYL